MFNRFQRTLFRKFTSPWDDETTAEAPLQTASSSNQLNGKTVTVDQERADTVDFESESLVVDTPEVDSTSSEDLTEYEIVTNESEITMAEFENNGVNTESNGNEHPTFAVGENGDQPEQEHHSEANDQFPQQLANGKSSSYVMDLSEKRKRLR